MNKDLFDLIAINCKKDFLQNIFYWIMESILLS